jgi:UDP-N-acetylmuramoylalanine--D-glutamate ligase
MSSRDYFKGKRVAVVGLGPHGEMVEDVKFLIKAGALVSIYDLRSEARLKSHLVFLRSIGLANYVCGSIPGEDLLDMNLIILSAEYPRESSFLDTLKGTNIPVEYPETLFFKLAPPVMFVGVMGRVGKSTVMSMLAPMLERTCEKLGGPGFFIIDPESDEGILAHLKKIKSGDIVLARIIEPMMKELSDIRISPHVAVFTTVPTKNAYRQNPFEILSFQTYNNFIVASDVVIDETHRLNFQARAKMFRTRNSIVPADWVFEGRGLHDKENAALALETARLFKTTDDDAREVLESWKPLKNRLEPVKKVRGIEIFNDSASVCEWSTHTALSCLAVNRNAVLIFGGANSGINYSALYKKIEQSVHTLILLPGSGTMRERGALNHLEGVTVVSAPSIEEAARLALDNSRKGDKIIFSPGFEAAGIDRSRLERGERFVRAVRAL